MKKVKVVIKGKSPLLMNQFIDKTNSETARGKKVYNAEEEAEKKTYRNAEGKLYLPSKHFKSSIIKVSPDFPMKGKKSYKDYIKSGIFIEPSEIILSPQEYTIHSEPVVIQRSRVMSWRPKFNEWSCSFEMEIVDNMISVKTMKEILETAGKYAGIGDYRPEYGRYTVESFEILS